MTKTMDRKIIMMLAVLTLAFASLAQAKLERLEKSFELQLTQISWPAHATGKVTIKPCAACDTVKLRVDARTSYHIGVRTPAVTLQELIDAADAVRGQPNTAVGVFYLAPSLVLYAVAQKYLMQMTIGGVKG